MLSGVALFGGGAGKGRGLAREVLAIEALARETLVRELQGDVGRCWQGKW